VNKSKIEWTDYTWNPVVGCLHGCEFCYAKRINKRFGDGRFLPTFYPKRLSEPLAIRKPSRIFVGSMADLFGDWDWEAEDDYYTRGIVVCEILKIVRQYLQHTFIFLTKNPRGMQDFDFPDNCWCGASVENQEKADERIPELLRVKCGTLFASYEPALGPVNFRNIPIHSGGVLDALKGIDTAVQMHYVGKLAWLIIGAQTGPGAVKSDCHWIYNAIGQAVNANVPVFVKDNVNWHEQIREWPEGVEPCV